jgi:hypothetical protein
MRIEKSGEHQPAGVADTGSQMNDYVYAVQWSREEKKFQVLKVPPLKHAQWGQHEYYWQAYVVADRWNEALRRLRT